MPVETILPLNMAWRGALGIEDSGCVIAHCPRVCNLLVVSPFSEPTKGSGDEVITRPELSGSQFLFFLLLSPRIHYPGHAL